MTSVISEIDSTSFLNACVSLLKYEENKREEEWRAFYDHRKEWRYGWFWNRRSYTEEEIRRDFDERRRFADQDIRWAKQMIDLASKTALSEMMSIDQYVVYRLGEHLG